MTEGSQTFEEDLARLINTNQVSRDEGLAHADSPTNLMWRLQNSGGPSVREMVAPPSESSDADETATFTEITLDVRPDDATAREIAPWLRR